MPIKTQSQNNSHITQMLSVETLKAAVYLPYITVHEFQYILPFKYTENYIFVSALKTQI